MKRYIKHSKYDIPEIHVTMYLKPIIYETSKIMSAVTFDDNSRRYHTDVNPSRIINGSLSPKGEALEEDVKSEYSAFIDDCKFLISECGFTIINSSTSTDSEKSEYFLVYGVDGEPCGTLVYDLRISDHPFDADLPEEWKSLALDYLKMNNVLDGKATEAGIDFVVEKVTVGTVQNDTWDRAFNRLYDKLRSMRNKVKVRNRRNT